MIREIKKEEIAELIQKVDELGRYLTNHPEVSGEEKAKIETEIENTKKALETNNTETIKEATEKLTKVFYEMSEQLYKNGNPNAGADANATTGASEANTNNAGNDGNVYDADYKVEDDNK